MEQHIGKKQVFRLIGHLARHTHLPIRIRMMNSARDKDSISDSREIQSFNYHYNRQEEHATSDNNGCRKTIYPSPSQCLIGCDIQYLL